VPTTVGRSRGRQGVPSGMQGAVGEHLSKIMTGLITGAVVIGVALVMTKPGRDIDAATQHFMLFYAGVFALIGLTASVGVGLLATDRIVMSPGHRVMAQAVHRAVSFGALAFLIIHIVTEILAQRVHVIDAFIPFLSPFRTFYIGLGTIASDLILLIVVTSIWRRRFTARGKAWSWRAIHYGAYVAFVFGVMHGLLGGRAAKPYVDWSYGFAIAFTALGLVVRFLAISLRSKHRVSAPPSADRATGGLGYSGTSPLRSAALGMAQAQLSGAIHMLPAGAGAQGTRLGVPGSQAWAALPAAPGWAGASGPLPALNAAPGYAADPAYADPALTPLGAPVYGDAEGYPYPEVPGRQPLYEPEYDGPPRFAGAPRGHMPQDDLSSYPYAAPGGDGAGPLPLGPAPRFGGGPTPRADSGPMPRLGTGPMPRADSGPMPRLGPGPTPRADSGPMPGPGTGPMPRLDPDPRSRPGRGPVPRADSGPMPRLGPGPASRADTGPIPRVDSGPMPGPGTGPVPRADTGPIPRVDSGPMPRLGAGPMPRPDSAPPPKLVAGPMPRPDTGPMPRLDPGPPPRPGTGPAPRADSGPMPRLGPGPASRADTGPIPRVDSGPMPGPGTGPIPRADSGPMPRLGSGPMPPANSGPMPRLGPGPVHGADSASAYRAGAGPAPRSGAGPNPRPPTGSRPRAESEPRPGAGPAPGPESPHGPRGGTAPATATRRSRRIHAPDPRYRDTQGHAGGDEWR
jgi:DMSO/TMAO reductase YedYZ heme-binding membrane subunit